MHRTTLLAAAAAALLTLPGCLIVSDRDTDISGAYVDNAAASKVVLHKTSPDQAIEYLGEPTERVTNDRGEDVLTWRWTKRTEDEGALFLVFAGETTKTETQSLSIAFRDGVAVRKSRN